MFSQGKPPTTRVNPIHTNGFAAGGATVTTAVTRTAEVEGTRYWSGPCMMLLNVPQHAPTWSGLVFLIHDTPPVQNTENSPERSSL